MTDEMLERYSRIRTPTLYDVLDKMGYAHQALNCAIRPLDLSMRALGRAYTVKGSPGKRWDGSAGSAMRYDLFRSLKLGDMIVMDTGGNIVSGPWGNNTGLSAKSVGAAGIVIDCDRVWVEPGDIVAGDADGVVVVPAALAQEVLEFAEAAQDVEDEMGKALAAGKDRESVDKRFDRWRLLRRRGRLS